MKYLRATGFEVERFISVPRTSWLRLSYGFRADDTGSGLDRRLSKARFIPGLLTALARLTGRTQQMVAVARRTV